MARYKGHDYAQWSHDNFNWNLTPRLEHVDVNNSFDAFPAQRDLDEERASGMAAVFLPSCADGVRIALLPDGRTFIVDGQHRIRAAQIAGWPALRALVYEIPNYEQACAMFHNVNGDGVVKTTPQAALNAAYESKRPREQHIWDILRDFNLSVVADDDSTLIQSATIIERIYDVDAGGLLALTIEVITDCWGFDYYKLSGKRNRIPVLSDAVLEGMALFLTHHPLVTERPFMLRELKRDLGKRDLADLMEKSHSSWIETDHKPKLAYHVEREIVATFNHKRNAGGNRLPDRTARDLMKLGDLGKFGKMRHALAIDEDEGQEGA